MQSIDSLRELNAKLLAEICELRKKFAEIEGENGELKNENAKLRRIIEENARQYWYGTQLEHVWDTWDIMWDNLKILGTSKITNTVYK